MAAFCSRSSPTRYKCDVCGNIDFIKLLSGAQMASEHNTYVISGKTSANEEMIQKFENIDVHALLRASRK